MSEAQNASFEVARDVCKEQSSRLPSLRSLLEEIPHNSSTWIEQHGQWNSSGEYFAPNSVQGTFYAMSTVDWPWVNGQPGVDVNRTCVIAIRTDNNIELSMHDCDTEAPFICLPISSIIQGQLVDCLGIDFVKFSSSFAFWGNRSISSFVFVCNCLHIDKVVYHCRALQHNYLFNYTSGAKG